MLSSIDPTDIFLGITILVSHTLGTMAGFGANVLSYPILLQFRDIYFVRPLLTVCGALFAFGVLLRYYRHINKREWIKALVLISLGMPIGMYLYAYLDKFWLQIILGLLTLFISIKGILELYFNKSFKQAPKYLSILILVFAGVFQGAISTGGTFSVIYFSQKLKDKHEFRATLTATMIVFVLITFLQLFIFVPKSIPKPGHEALISYLVVLPFLISAIFIGNTLASKVPQLLFRKIVHILLGLASISTFINAFHG